MLSAESARPRRERGLLLMLLDHPAALAQVVEALAVVQFLHPATESLRAALCTHAEDLFGLDSPALVDQLRLLGLSQALETVLGPAISSLPRPRLDGAGPGEVVAAWFAEFTRLEPERMAHEIAAAQDAFRADPTEGNERRLARLAQARNEALSALPVELPPSTG